MRQPGRVGEFGVGEALAAIGLSGGTLLFLTARLRASDGEALSMMSSRAVPT